MNLKKFINPKIHELMEKHLESHMNYGQNQSTKRKRSKMDK